MATKSGQLYYKGQAVSSKTIAKDVIVEDLNNLFTAGDLENVLAEVMTKSDVANKVDKIAGMGLSQENYTTDEKNKLAGIENNANHYVLPSTLPASMITEDSSRKFVSDSQISSWNAAASGSSVQTLLDSNLAQSKTYTDTSISNLKGAVPSTLNTLTKIAAAINNDPSYCNTIKAYVDSKLVSFAGRGAINVENESELDYMDVNVGDVVNLVTNTITFYQCTNSTATTFSTRFTVTANRDRSTCTQATDQSNAMALSLSNGDYIYIITTVINNSYECITNDPSIAAFDDKYRILYKNSYVENRFTQLINGAPGTLDTLNELAAALNDDANFATHMTNNLTDLNNSITTVDTKLTNFTSATNSALALKAPINSPVFTGTVKTAKNILDDGAGNMTIAGEINMSSANGHIAPLSNGRVGFTNNAKNAWGLYVGDNSGGKPVAGTNNNILDDGNGNMTVAGNTQINGALYFNAVMKNTDTTMINKNDIATNISSLDITVGDDGVGDVIPAPSSSSTATDYVAIKSTNKGIHHLFGTDGTYQSAGTATFGKAVSIGYNNEIWGLNSSSLLWINYRGKEGDITSSFSDTSIGNGKGIALLSTKGSTGAVTSKNNVLDDGTGAMTVGALAVTSNAQVNGSLYFKSPGDNTDAMYISKNDIATDISSLEIFIGDNGSGTAITQPSSSDYLTVKSTNKGIHHLFGADGTYVAATSITAPTITANSFNGLIDGGTF